MAGRLIGLLDDDYSADPELARAYAATRMMVLQKPAAAGWSVLDEQLEDFRQRRVQHLKQRHRRRLRKPDASTPIHRGRKNR